MQYLRFISAFTLASILLLAVGCSKNEPESAPSPAPSENREKVAPAPAKPSASPSAEATPAPVPPPVPAPVPSPSPTTSSGTGEETPAQLAAQVQQLESTYHNTPDFQKRVGMIYDLTSIESPATIDAVGRLFAYEPDPELKVELINSLSDIDGENDKKLAILTSALRPDQPKDVRLEAIDAIAETEDKRGIQILQGILQDPDEDIRESAQDSIDQLQPNMTNPQ